LQFSRLFNESGARGAGKILPFAFIMKSMTLDQILASLDAEIAQLKRARALLSGTAATKTAPPQSRRNGKMSAEGRKRIAEAQRKRWALQKKASNK
jgi:hypothetical protein